ncbi:MAG: hypothetical protein COV07_02395 [Candidatus Vogelbacteria bacterium CG10_big_fil_rev_8_21_14_0_10_45_14]|uniref:Uncharacterized protein n=1 Tax=Candidatus Vogelbacteria bacterium CG10_big_fil_rev_8_21_14_0_10_45_14 TaxID=1975042 RepID=A0A2H0RJY7_9BACT|nr:MAG: hypothetical protein COV07_02395 [Candidatus Vogelbacteria bacterium CG10_big_fil_rev_8_21_14_0_10_45_14]
MIDTRNQNYSETLLQIAKLQDLVDMLEKNIFSQLPQGVANKFISTKDKFINWVEEAEFILQDYKI